MEEFKVILIIPHKNGQLKLNFYLPTSPVKNGYIILPIKNGCLKLKIKKVLSSMYNDQFIIFTRQVAYKITEILNAFKKIKQKEFKLVIVIPKFNLQKTIPKPHNKEIFNDIRYGHQEIYLPATAKRKILVEIIKIIYQLNKSQIIITIKPPYAINKQTLIKYGWSRTKQKGE